MQAKVTNPELRQALTEFFQKRFNVAVQVVAIDFKGIRSEEGYHANVELHFDGIDYQAEALPKVISHEQSHEPEEKQSKPKDIFSMYPEIQEILQLMQNNPRHLHTQEIIDKVESSPHPVQEYFLKHDLYQMLLESFTDHVNNSEPEEVEQVVNNNYVEPEEEETKQTDDIFAEPVKPTVKYNIFGQPIDN